MNTKLKLHKKKLIYMGILFLMIILFSKNNNNSNEYIFNKKIDTKTYYKREQVYLIFDMKTGACKEYLLNKKINNNYILEETYDLEKNMVKFSNIITKEEYKLYYNYLKSNQSVVFLEDLGDYLYNLEIKDYYTLNEIRFLEPYLFSVISNQFVKKDLIK